MLSGSKPLSIYTKENENQLVPKLFTHEIQLYKSAVSMQEKQKLCFYAANCININIFVQFIN